MQIVSGIMGQTEGFITNQTQITEDNDGRFTDGYFNGVVDLTHILSKLTGRQLSQMANYRVGQISIQLRNVNDAADNDNTMHIGGDIEWYAPHSKRIDALQSLRTFMRDEIAHTNKGDEIWQTADKNYTGLRLGWDGDTQVESPSSDGTSSAFTSSKLNLRETFDRYNYALGGGVPGSEGYDDSGYGQALWSKRTPIYTSKMPFNCAYTNPLIQSGYSTPASFQVFEWQSQYSQQAISVMGGLLAINLKHGNTDAVDFIEDEYEMIVSIGIEGWSEF